MGKRFGTVIWWLGTLFGGFCLTGGIVATVSKGDMSLLILPLVVTPCAWAVAFIFGGSFWRPPRSRP